MEERKMMKRKCLAVGIILLFVGTYAIPSVSSERTYHKNIITVDDEPNDADYTSIREALNHTNPNDVIEVYSGTYDEHNLTITEDGISLIGMPYELGNGNDTGKPFINGNGCQGKIIRVEAVNVTVSGFRIQNLGGESLLSVYYKSDRCVISSNYFCYASNYAISLCGNYSKITNNTISNTGRYGIGIINYHNMISDNIIENCNMGITLGWGGFSSTINRNRVSNCSQFGIDVGGADNVFQFNTLKNNFCGLHIYQSVTNKIIQNNFINNTYQATFELGLSFMTGNRFFQNYWEHPRLLPYPIIGTILLFVPWVQFDWHPAREPYDIPGMT